MEGRREYLEKSLAPLMLTPLERFLSSPCERELNLTPNRVAPKAVKKKDEMRINHHPNDEFNNGGTIFSGECGPYVDDGLLVNGGGASNYCSFNNGGFGGKNSSNEILIMKGKGVKGGSSSSSSTSTTTTTTTTTNNNVVKGQWTAEEDSLLVKLVKQHGVRKWSQIAKKLVGRIGKQCRERWHNHLRPDIKKDTWSEDEERLLVEVHEKVGNRWAEIAKRIPGRSENSIKNHWNATKRRQNSKRRTKRSKSTNGSSGQHSSILQDYIRSKILTLTKKLPTTTTPPPQCNEYSSSTATHVGECMQPMQNFYVGSEGLGFQAQEPYNMHDILNFFGDDGLLMNMDELLDCCPQEALEVSSNNNGGFGVKEINNGQLDLDTYISYLLDGGPSPCFNDVYEGDDNKYKFLGDQEASLISSDECKRDMDLIEMISSSQSSCSQRSNSSRSFT